MAFSKPGDVLASNSGSIIATINGKNINLGEVKEFEAKLEPNVEEVEILGRRMKGHKVTSVEGTGSTTMYLVSSRWAKIIADWKEGGAWPDISFTVTAEDKGSSAKKQVVQLIGVTFEEADLATFDAGDDLLEAETDFKFDDFKIIQAFNE